MIQLGSYVRDQITGFEGTVTGLVTYLTGCSQALVEPMVNRDGEAREAAWFGQQRLVADLSIMPIVLDNGPTPGHDLAPPKR